MNLLRVSIILEVAIVSTILFVPQGAFGIKSPQNLTLGDQFPLWKNYDGYDLIINQVANKTTYNTWEPITISAELINNGTRTVTLNHYLGWEFIQVKYPNGVMWPGMPIGIPLINPTNFDILKPGEHLIMKLIYPGDSFRLGGTGKYKITSSAIFSVDYNSTLMLLSSKPLQITVVPEFPVATVVLIIGIITALLITRMKWNQI